MAVPPPLKVGHIASKIEGVCMFMNVYVGLDSAAGHLRPFLLRQNQWVTDTDAGLFKVSDKDTCVSGYLSVEIYTFSLLPDFTSIGQSPCSIHYPSSF